MPDITLSPVVDSLDAVPEGFRASYEQGSDGRFSLTKPITIDDPSELKSALQRERTEAKELRTKLHGIPADYAERIDRAEKAERDALLRTGDVDGIAKIIEGKYSGQLAAREKELTSLRSAMIATQLQTAGTAAISEAGGSVRGLLPHVLPHLRTVETAPGQFDVVVFDPNNPDRARLGRDNKPMTIASLVAELKADDVLSRLFEGPRPTGRAGVVSTFRAGSDRMVQLTADQAKDPRVYETLKEQKKKGEIGGAYDAEGRRLV